MAEHTPGPWYDDGYRIHAPTDDEDKRNGRVIVEYKHVDGFNDADAPLIAAAPELLAALEHWFNFIETSGSDVTLAAVKPWTGKMHDAIAKARGDVPPRR